MSDTSILVALIFKVSGRCEERRIVVLVFVLYQQHLNVPMFVLHVLTKVFDVFREQLLTEKLFRSMLF